IPVDVGEDKNGKIISSCVIEPVNDQDRPKPEKTTANRRSSAYARTLELLTDAIAREGQIPPANNHIPAGKLCVAEELWRDYCYRGAISDSSQAAKQKSLPPRR